MFGPRLKVQVRAIETDENFHLKTERVLKAITDTREEGLSPLAVIFVNPNNPLGDIAPAEQLRELINICNGDMSSVHYLFSNNGVLVDESVDLVVD